MRTNFQEVWVSLAIALLAFWLFFQLGLIVLIIPLLAIVFIGILPLFLFVAALALIWPQFLYLAILIGLVYLVFDSKIKSYQRRNEFF